MIKKVFIVTLILLLLPSCINIKIEEQKKCDPIPVPVPYNIEETKYQTVRTAEGDSPRDRYNRVVQECLRKWPDPSQFNRFLDCIYQYL